MMVRIRSGSAEVELQQRQQQNQVSTSSRNVGNKELTQHVCEVVMVPETLKNLQFQFLSSVQTMGRR